MSTAPHGKSASGPWLAGGALFVFFLALFAQFPLQGALPGNTDTLLAIALSNVYHNHVASFLGGAPAGVAMYPAGALMYGEKAPAVALAFSLFKLAGLNDVAAYYLLLSLIFTLTGLGVFLFSGLFLRSFPARLFAAFGASCSNLLFTHIDDAAVWLTFLPLVALTYLARAYREKNPALAYRAAIAAGAQIYFSMYVFVFQGVMLGGLVLYHRLARRDRLPRQVAFKSVLLFAAVAGPLFATYVWAKARLAIVDPWDPFFLIRILSLTLSDFTQALPTNLLYGGDRPQTWYATRHQNFIGLLLIGAGAFALARSRRHRMALGAMGLVGLLMAMGPEIMTTFSQEPGIPAPMYPVYHWLPLAPYLRVPVRAYFFVQLALAILAGITLESLLQRFSKPVTATVIIVLFFGIHFLENVPFPFTAYKLEKRLSVPSEYATYIQSQPAPLVLDLPSDFRFAYDNWQYGAFADPNAYVQADPDRLELRVSDVSTVAGSDREVFAYNRDMYYMNWQTQHKQNIIGGLNAYFPASRLIFDRFTKDLPGEHALRWLRKQGVTHIAYHREMIIPGDPEVVYGLETSPLLRKVVDGERSQIFEFIEAEGRAKHD